jgi:hypothetical protein
MFRRRESAPQLFNKLFQSLNEFAPAMLFYVIYVILDIGHYGGQTVNVKMTEFLCSFILRQP